MVDMTLTHDRVLKHSTENEYDKVQVVIGQEKLRQTLITQDHTNTTGPKDVTNENVSIDDTK